MKIALVLHLYQPPTQEEAVFRAIFTQCYHPLIKLLKSKKNIYLTLNVPLSLLEQADRYGYGDWIGDIRDLYASERVELVGSAAYHPLLTKLSRESGERQIVLNEYSLGYYFGSRTGFEGEPAVMVKNVRGFFAPECAINNDVVEMVGDLGYEWVLSDQTAIHNLSYESYKPCYYNVKDSELKIIPRNKKLSDAFSFNRGSSIESLVGALFEGGGINVIALDGETFGHHNPDGIFMLEDLAFAVNEKGGSFVTVSQIIPELQQEKIDGVLESTWGASYEDMSKGDVYPFWSGNKIQAKLAEIEKHLSKYLPEAKDMPAQEPTTQPLWFYHILSDITQEVRDYLHMLLLIMKYEHSDKYWWSSKKPILGNPELFHPGMIENSLKIVDAAAELVSDEKERKKILSLAQEVRSMLES